MRIGDFFAHLFSIVFNPLLMTLYSVALLFSYTNFFDIYPGQFFRFLLPVFIFTALIPGIFILVLKKLRIVKDLTLTERKDRILPYLMTCFSNATLLYYFYSGNTYIWFLGILAVPVIIPLVGVIINSFFKISVHMMGIGALLGTAMSVCYSIKGLNPFLLFIILFILAGMVAVSRLYLKKNATAEIYIGFFVGFAVSFLSVFFSAYFMNLIIF